MIAFKFLAPGCVAPFTGAVWPAGAWMTAPAGAPPESWIHACRSRDLPYWTDAELWKVELAGRICETRFQLQAERARIVGRMPAWEAGVAREFILACALRTRDFALEALADLGVEAGELARAATLDELRTASRLLRSQPLSSRAMHLLGYCLDGAIAGRTGHAGSVSHVAAIAAADLRGAPSAAYEERAWQARWLCERLAIEPG